MTGELTTPAPKGEIDAPLEVAPAKKKSPGRSAEAMREMTRERVRRQKAGEIPMGGRARIRRKRHEIEEDAIQKLIPQALKVLEEQLYDPDERVRQAAAVKVLEWGRGKPQQAVKVEGDSVHTIRYETVVALPEVIEIEDAELVFDELTGGLPELPPAA